MNIESRDEHPREPGGNGLMSKPEVALWLGVSVGALDTYRRKEGLPFIKMGRRVLFDRGDVGRWLGKRAKNKGGG